MGRDNVKPTATSLCIFIQAGLHHTHLVCLWHLLVRLLLRLLRVLRLLLLRRAILLPVNLLLLVLWWEALPLRRPLHHKPHCQMSMQQPGNYPGLEWEFQLVAARFT